MSNRIAVMNNAHILQVGTQHDIYDHPKERFVAEFIGESNFLTGTAKGAEGDNVRVDLSAGGTIVARALDDKQRERVTVAVRPEQAAICDVTASDAVMTGVVSNVVYLGTDTHFHIDLPDGTPFSLRTQNAPGRDEDPAVGAQVGIRIAPGVAQELAN